MRYSIALLMTLVAAVGCGHRLPPAAQMMHPGPGVGGPGPGVVGPIGPNMGGGCGPGQGMMGASQIHFVGPEGMNIQWDMGGDGQFNSDPLVAPVRYNFGQGQIYRLKLMRIAGYEGVELYPTIEVAPVLPRTAAYLEHNAIPVQFTQEDLDQVLSGNFVTKVIYLPDAEYQELAVAGVETLVSTRLDPGVDPIVEADRRGSILAIIRLGNKMLEQVAGDEVGGGAMMAGGGGFGGGMPDGYNGGQWGMPITGTPIGLPGPPHVPLGVPAGLQKHEIRNHTRTRIPEPTESIRVNARQVPGVSYPQPANRMRILEWNR